LNHPRNDQLGNTLRHATTDAAHSEQGQSDEQYWLAPPPVAGPSQRNLQNALSQSIGAESDAGHGKAGFGIMNSVDAENREDQKDAEQPQCGYQTDDNHRAEFSPGKRVLIVSQCVARAPRSFSVKIISLIYTLCRKWEGSREHRHLKVNLPRL
jgi:hypothetical protein